jgi:electron transfer flavoprotein beta subunit
MKAKKKELKVLSLADIGMETAQVGSEGSLLEVLEITLPPARAAGKLLSGDAADVAKQLVDLLKNEAKVI